MNVLVSWQECHNSNSREAVALRSLAASGCGVDIAAWALRGLADMLTNSAAAMRLHFLAWLPPPIYWRALIGSWRQMPIAAILGSLQPDSAPPGASSTRPGLLLPKLGRYEESVHVTPSEREVAVDRVLLVAISSTDRPHLINFNHNRVLVEIGGLRTSARHDPANVWVQSLISRSTKRSH